MENVREQLLRDLAACIRIGHQAVLQGRPESCPEAVRWKEAFEYWADVLEDENAGADDVLEGVAALCQRIIAQEKEKPHPVREHRTGRGSSSADALHCERSRKQFIIADGAGQARRRDVLWLV